MPYPRTGRRRLPDGAAAAGLPSPDPRGAAMPGMIPDGWQGTVRRHERCVGNGSRLGTMLSRSAIVWRIAGEIREPRIYSQVRAHITAI